jgi:hypothetical protein
MACSFAPPKKEQAFSFGLQLTADAPIAINWSITLLRITDLILKILPKSAEAVK